MNEMLAKAQQAITNLENLTYTEHGIPPRDIEALQKLFDAYQKATGDHLDPDEFDEWLYEQAETNDEL